MFPCSFAEGTPGWGRGVPLDVPPEGDLLEAAWNHPRLNAWVVGLLMSSSGCSGCDVRKHCRSCPIYDITPCNPKPDLHGNESPIQIKRREHR
jgi:hypothetical protein